VRKLCKNCKKQVEPGNKIKEIILQGLASLPEVKKKEIDLSNLKIFEPQGCKKCNSSGFSGRIALFEILEMTKELAEIVLHEPSESKIAEEALRQGMITMKQDGILKAMEGITTIQEVIRVAEEK